MQCNCSYRTGDLPCKVRAVGSNPLSEIGKKKNFFLSFPPLLFPCSVKLTALRVYLGVCASVAGSPTRLSGGPSYHRLRP